MVVFDELDPDEWRGQAVSWVGLSRSVWWLLTDMQFPMPSQSCVSLKRPSCQNCVE
jgi:hypothetical protein